MQNTVTRLVPHGLNRFLLAVVAGVIFLVNGCSEGDNLEKNLQDAGGVKCVLTACNDIRNKLLELEYLTDIPAGNCLNLLKPQYVGLIEKNGLEFYNIQVSGGFHHAGYLVTSKKVPLESLPFPKWKKKHLSDGVYIYKE